MPTAKKLPYDFIQCHYREPATGDPIRRWLPHPEVAQAICDAFLAGGMPECDFEDALQDVYVKALAAFCKKQEAKKDAEIPGDLRAMKAYCAAIARNHTVDTLRRAAQREIDFVGLCENPDEYGPLEYGAERRDPVDAGRQLEVLAQLFRDGRMPENGVDILEGIACGCSLRKVGADLGIGRWAVKGRMDTMRQVFRVRMVELGLLPSMQSLRVIVSVPRAIETLRMAA